MGRGGNGFLNASHMKNKRLKKARKEEPYWGLVNIGTQGVQELFFSEIGAFMELFTVMIWLIWQVFLVAMYSKKETGS